MEHSFRSICNLAICGLIAIFLLFPAQASGQSGDFVGHFRANPDEVADPDGWSQDWYEVRIGKHDSNDSPAQESAMQPLGEAEMDEITAQGGFSEFTVENNLATAWLNIDVETNATIENFRANLDEGADPNDPANWDQDWYEVRIGKYDYDAESDEYNPDFDNPLKLRGFVLEAEFADDVGSPGNHLHRLKMGFESVNGEISADDFASFTGFYGAGREAYYRQARGEGTFTFDGHPIYMILDARGYGATDPANQPGVYMDFGEAAFDSP